MSRISEILSALAAEQRLRFIAEPPDKPFLDLSSNDYLGLAQRHTDLMEEFTDRFHDAAFTSSASRLLSTNQKYHFLLESFLARLYGKDALLFNSGYHANVGCIGALTLPSTLFLCDKLIHASVIDGLRIAGAEFKRFPHNDISKLRKMLEKEVRHFERIIVVAESIYSMDGDLAPLKELVELKRYYPTMLLYVDEAHAFGVRGARGLGLCEEYSIIEQTDILVGTFGKAAASVGAFAIIDKELKSLFINTARPFIFSTALPPVNVAWSLLMTEKISHMSESRQHLSELSAFFSRELSDITGCPTGSSSQIIPLITGDAALAINIAQKLRDKGYLALPIRRPTVPPGGERIRFSLSAGMDMDKLYEVLKTLKEIL